LEIRFHKRPVSFLVVQTVKCKCGISQISICYTPASMLYSTLDKFLHIGSGPSLYVLYYSSMSGQAKSIFIDASYT